MRTLDTKQLSVFLPDGMEVKFQVDDYDYISISFDDTNALELMDIEVAYKLRDFLNYALSAS